MTQEPSIAEILADPMIATLNASDGVDARTFATPSERRPASEAVAANRHDNETSSGLAGARFALCCACIASTGGLMAICL